ncbi:MAG: ATP-binding protein [Anaerolineae bacterium]|nr:ATP-binding protein [Anaerolineae bacterium]MDQ7037069.1 ATP-binding protein [Anaerolineae bacterium]
MAENKGNTSALMRLLGDYSYKRITDIPEPDLGLAEHRPYPFIAVVGQVEMRTALLLAVINPAIGGVLLIGPRGTGKTTAVRSITGILPHIEVSDCEESVLPEDLENLDEEDAKNLYPDCYEKFKKRETISHYEAVRLVELPLNARIEDVVGGLNERAAVHRNLVRVERGILSRADNNILYVDEVNLLDDQIVDVILDAAAQGSYTVRRGAVSGTYRARFVLVGSMNPEEGRLRPQILDRFGLRVNVRGLMNPEDRSEIYHRVRAYRRNPTRFIRQWEAETTAAEEDIIIARELLKDTTIPDNALQCGLELIQKLEIDSHRAEYTMFEAARAYTAADGRVEVTISDIRAVAAMALRQRRSEFMLNFFTNQVEEDKQINKILDDISPEDS